MIYSADISEFNPRVDDSYPYRWLDIRCCDGSHLDLHAVGNADWCRGAVLQGRMAGWTAYVVYRPGMNAAVLNNLAKIVPLDRVEIDIESWANTTSPIRGDHSADINSLALDLATIVGIENVWRYGNAGDLASIHPHPWPGALTRVAKYGPTAPSGVANLMGWQYSNGVTASGARPLGANPFGHCDMNELYVDQLDPSGGGVPIPNPVPNPAPSPEEDMQKDVLFMVGDGPDIGQTWLLMTNGYYLPVFNETEENAYKSVGAVVATGDAAGASITGAAHLILKNKMNADSTALAAAVSAAVVAALPPSVTGEITELTAIEGEIQGIPTAEENATAAVALLGKLITAPVAPAVPTEEGLS